MGTLIKIAYRNIWRNMRRTVSCFAAVGIAVFFIAVYTSLIDGMVENMNDLVQVFDLGHVKVVSAQYEAENEYMPVQYPVASSASQPLGKSWKEIAANIKKIPGVVAVFPRISSMATLQESVVKHAILWGLNIEDEMKMNNFNFVNRNNGLVHGRYPSPDSNECAIGYIFAEKSGLNIGDRLPLKTVSAQFSDKIWSPVITGIFNYEYRKLDEQYIIVDFTRLQRLLVLGEGTQVLVTYTSDGKTSAGIAAAMQNMFEQDAAESAVAESAIAEYAVVVTDWQDNYWVAVMKMATPLYTIIFLVFLIVASFLIINTVVMIIHERIKEIGMMGCLGMTRKEIILVFFFESFFLAAFGALAGVIVGGLVTGIGSHFPIRMMEQFGSTFAEMPLGNALFFQFSFVKLFQAWLMGVFIASLFTLIPSLKSAFVEPVEALRR